MGEIIHFAFALVVRQLESLFSAEELGSGLYSVFHYSHIQ